MTSRSICAAGILTVLDVASVRAQALDPLLFLKDAPPTVLVMVDSGSRMQSGSPTRLTLARTAVSQAVRNNRSVARFGLYTSRQIASDATTVVAVDAPDANARIVSALGANAALPDGRTANESLASMLDDLRAEAARVLTSDANAGCRNLLAVFITGGPDPSVAAGDAGAAAAKFQTMAAGRRVPVIVIALAPAAGDVPQLRSIAVRSGGQYLDTSDVSFAGALDIAVQTAFQTFADLNTAPAWNGPWKGWTGYAGSQTIPSSEFQMTPPLRTTVDLNRARDINGDLLSGPPSAEVLDRAGTRIAQRQNVIVTAGFVLPGFDGIVRGFRMYKPIADARQASGFTFRSDGTPLWIASPPGDPSRRNLFTVRPDGSLLALSAANAPLLAPLMNMSAADAADQIAAFRRMPIGAIVDSTPAVEMAPSADLTSDDSYRTFAAAHAGRRALVWVGTNRGVLEAIDARTGLEVWGFVPVDLLPRLAAIRDGQSVGAFEFLMDGSPSIADVRLAGGCGADRAGGCWRTHLVVGEGPGGAFYHSFDVTLPDITAAVAPDSDDRDALLAYFADPSRIRLNWSFQAGQTWSTPVIGQIGGASAPSGVVVAGTSVSVLDASTGAVLSTAEMSGVVDADLAVAGANRRYVTKAYAGDLGGRIWRFDFSIDPFGAPSVSATNLYTVAGARPIVSRAALVTVGGATQYVFVGTGGDRLPSEGVVDRLIGLVDSGSSGTATLDQPLRQNAAAVDERVAAAPAVAGDIVFFTTTSTSLAAGCRVPAANLYAMTFLGGAAYDTNNDGTFDRRDGTLTKTVPGRRATAPSVADRHLVFGAGGDVIVLGDPDGFNNGRGPAGARIVSWREVR